MGQSIASVADEIASRQSIDFSLVTGGPLFQLWRRTHLSGDALQFPHRRAIVLALLAWLPLLLLSLLEGHAWGSGVALTFLEDVETHVRVLIAIPLLIVAEVAVHQRISPIAREFLDRGLITQADRARFDAAIASAMRLRNSVWVEALIILFVYGVGVFVWRAEATLEVSSWYAIPGKKELELSQAGWWAACVSLPLLQFLVLRWYFRLFIWGRFLRQVSRMDLQLMPTHPDGSGGLHFLSVTTRAFSLVLLAQGAVLSGLIANRIFQASANLMWAGNATESRPGNWSMPRDRRASGDMMWWPMTIRAVSRAFCCSSILKNRC